MISTGQLIMVIGVYLLSVCMMYKGLENRMKGMETEYRLNFARVCTTFTDTMQSVIKALEAVGKDENDKESSNE